MRDAAANVSTSTAVSVRGLLARQVSPGATLAAIHGKPVTPASAHGIRAAISLNLTCGNLCDRPNISANINCGFALIRRRKRFTIADVADMASVSAITVSRVINNKTAIKLETRQRVMRVIRDLDYEPNHSAQSLTGSRSYTIGVIVVDIANPFFAEITAGIETISWQPNYSVILCNTQEDQRRERQVLRMLEAKQVNGVIVCSTRLSDADLPTLLDMFPA